jgi:hypothetical protein
MQWSNLMEKVDTFSALYGLRVVSALAIFVIGRWVAKGITRIIERLMVKRKVDTTEKVKKAFDANGITIPFPQRDVHIRSSVTVKTTNEFTGDVQLLDNKPELSQS